MKELKEFYDNHFKTNEMPVWEELSNEQITKLKESFGYYRFQMNRALKVFRRSCDKELENRKSLIRRLFKNNKK
jgi:hypothetical protein